MTSRSHQLVADLRKGLTDDEIAAAELRAGELVTGPPQWPEEVDGNIVKD